MIENPEKWKGRILPFASELLGQEDVVAILNKVTGKPHKYIQAPYDALPNEMFAAMFQYLNDCGTCGWEKNEPLPYPEMSDLGIKLTSFEEFVRQQIDVFGK